MAKERNSNLELYRIIVMMLIVAHHYVVNSGLLDVMNSSNNFSSGRTFFYYIFGLWGKIGINCFVLITGYFMCTSNITLRKYLKLLLEVEFYHVVFYFIFVSTGYIDFTAKGFLAAAWPVMSVSDGFASCFLLFYLCIPFLNILVRNMDARKHAYAIALGLFIYSVLGSIPPIRLDMNYVSWFCEIYLIASYIRLYNIPYKNDATRWGGHFLLSVIITIGLIFVTWKFFAIIGRTKGVMFFVRDSNMIMSVIVSVCAFNFFRNLKMPYNRYINMIGGSTFGVLLIHAGSDNMRRWLWHDTLKVTEWYPSDYFILHAFLSVFFVFFVCILIDRIRIILLEEPLLNKIWIEDKRC